MKEKRKLEVKELEERGRYVLLNLRIAVLNTTENSHGGQVCFQ
jgi:hypothetical protein